MEIMTKISLRLSNFSEYLVGIYLAAKIKLFAYSHSEAWRGVDIR
jgi:hypothetical protein